METLLMKPVKSAAFLVIVTFAIFISACKKDNTPPGTTTTAVIQEPYTITITGDKFINETLEFTTNVPEDVAIQWLLFINTNGSSSRVEHTERSFTYKFTDVGFYSVTLVIDGDNANKNGQNLNSAFYIKKPFNAADIYKMQGEKMWEVVEDSAEMFSEKRTVINTYKDTFQLNIISEKMIVAKGDTLVVDSAQQVSGIEDHYMFSKKGTEAYSWSQLFYYPQKNSIILSVHPPQGGKQIGKSQYHTYGITTTYTSVK